MKCREWSQGAVLVFLALCIPGPISSAPVEADRGEGERGGGEREGTREESEIPRDHDLQQPCPKTNNQSRLNSFLWMIKRDPPSFFFGTIHVPYTRVWPYMPENTKEAFYRADNVHFELDLTDPYTISALANCQLLPHGESLADVIPRDLFLRLKQHLDYVKVMMPTWMTQDQKGRGLYADYLFNAITGNWERNRPVWVMLMVNSLTEADVRWRGVPVLDLYLAQEAQRLNKHTGAVEEVMEQCLPLNDLNFSQVVFALNQTLRQHEHQRQGTRSSGCTAEDLIGHYNCGSLDTVLFNHDTAQVPNLVNTSLPPHALDTARQIDEYFRDELIYKRNQRMADRIQHLLNRHPDKSFFFAFGAGHFLGNNSVIEAMEARGFDIEHVPPTKEFQFSKKYEKKRRKFPPLVADLAQDYSAIPPSAINGNLQYLDPFYDRRRNRHRHGQRDRNRGRRKNRRRQGGGGGGAGEAGAGAGGQSHNPSPTDSDRLKRPQFHDLWVRLEASSFDGSNLFNSSAESRPTPRPVYAMYNNSSNISFFSAASFLPWLVVLVALVTRGRVPNK